MRGVKAILAFVLGAAYAPSWWYTACCREKFGLVAIMETVFLFLFCLLWLCCNWGDE